MSQLILVDNTVLCNFALVQRGDVLQAVFINCAITYEVWDEYEKLLVNKQVQEMWENLPRFVLTSAETVWMNGLSSRLGRGECSTLSVAWHRQGGVMTDDRDARRVAQQLGIAVSGTLGALVVAVKKNYLSYKIANQLLQQMIANGYYSPVQRLEDLPFSK